MFMKFYHVNGLCGVIAVGNVMRFSGLGQSENGIIFGTAMAEKRLENDKMRYSAAYPTGAER